MEKVWTCDHCAATMLAAETKCGFCGKRRPKPLPNRGVGQIVLRVPMARKVAYVRAAKPGKLAEWCINALDAAEARKP